MINYDSITPHARVRVGESFIGTVERLDGVTGAETDDQGSMLVLSDDGHWRYRLPLALVTNVEEATFPILDVVVDVDLAPEDLPRYALGVGVPADEVTTIPREEATGDDIRVPLREEQLSASTQQSVLGHLRIHKGIESHEERFQVPVLQERAVIERIPPEQYDGKGPRSPDEVIIPILEERLVVQKQTVVKEYLRISKENVSKQMEVRGQVRRETVQISEERADGDDVSGDHLYREAPAGGGETHSQAQ